jgi:hypothetical protein
MTYEASSRISRTACRMGSSQARMAMWDLARIWSFLCCRDVRSSARLLKRSKHHVRDQRKSMTDNENRKGKIDERFQETYDKLIEIRNNLDRLTMTQAWSLRETDLFMWQRKLDRIDDSRRDGNFFDAEGRAADLHAQRVCIPSRSIPTPLTLPDTSISHPTWIRIRLPASSGFRTSLRGASASIQPTTYSAPMSR